ncbi:ParA family protein, partial [Vibrio barjaei]
IMIDNGPHVDSNLIATLCATDIITVPVAPTMIDSHSTYKFTTRLPDLLHTLVEEGERTTYPTITAFVTKFVNHGHQAIISESAFKVAQKIFGDGLFRTPLIESVAFSKTSETFKTVCSQDPNLYDGSRPALKKAISSVEKLADEVAYRIDLIAEVTKKRTDNNVSTPIF